METLTSEAYKFDGDLGCYNGNRYSIIYFEESEEGRSRVFVYALSKEEAVGVFLMTNPRLGYKNVIAVGRVTP